MNHLNKSGGDKMATDEVGKGKVSGELISGDKIKKEPEETVLGTVSKTVSVAKPITILTSPNSTKTSTAQPKTILLVQTVNSRTGGIQSVLLPQGLRNLTPSTTAELSFSSARARTSTLATVVTASIGKSITVSTAAPPRMSECVMSSPTIYTSKVFTSPTAGQVNTQAHADINSIVKLSTATAPVPPKVCEITFNSRTIKADGTVCTLKEYLCNFCQFKVASQDEFREHFLTHVFSCNYCSFRAFTRYEVLSHKKDKHQGIAEELAGYEGLDSFADQLNTLVSDWHTAAPVGTTVTVSTGDSLPSVTEASESAPPPPPPAIILYPKQTSAVSVSSSTVRSFSSASPMAVQSCILPATTSLVSVGRTFTLSSQPLATTSVLATAVAAPKKTTVVGTVPSGTTISPAAGAVKTTAGIGKSNDNYFTYKIVHDTAGKVQAYECDVCSYRSTKINEIFAHASTHSLTDLMKSNSVNVQWECFYCNFTSVLQANIVSHVIAKHPKQPIQLKRMVTNASAQQRAASRSILLKSTNIPSETAVPTKAVPTPTVVKKEKSPDEVPQPPVPQPPPSASTAAASAAAAKPDEADDGCMWGCYYCSVQSVDRNEIILHLKKDHAQQKLVITRRRITHIPAPRTSGPPKPEQKPKAAEASHQDQTESDSAATAKTNSDVQIGDIDSTDPQHSMLKSRRKQVFPRKVAEDASNDDAAKTEKSLPAAAAAVDKVVESLELTDAIQNLKSSSSSRRKLQNAAKSRDAMDETDSKQSDGGGGIAAPPERIKRSRRNEMKSEEQPAKKMKLGIIEAGKDTMGCVDLSMEVSGTEAGASAAAASNLGVDGQETIEDASMPALEDVSNFVKSKPVPGKSPGTAVPSEHVETLRPATVHASSIETTAELDKEMPVLHPEPAVPAETTDSRSSFAANRPGLVNGCANKGGVDERKPLVATSRVRVSNDRRLVRTQLHHFDKRTMKAHCHLCSAVVEGLNARSHMLEHVMQHVGGHLWSCPYCPLKCPLHLAVVLHITKKHPGRSSKQIWKKVYSKSTGNCGSIPCETEAEEGILSRGKPREFPPASKLRGPRRIRESRMIRTSQHMWQCPFCGRRSIFKGAVRVHLKVAHPGEDCEAKLRRLARPVARLCKNPAMLGDCTVEIVPIEDMHHYETLSTLLLDNGVSLSHDLDIDEEEEDSCDGLSVTVDRSLNSQKYRCTQCQFRNPDIEAIKNHVLEMHPSESVTIVVHRAGAGPKTCHLFMCRNADCSFTTNRQELLTGHLCKAVADKSKASAENKTETVNSESQNLTEASSRNSALRAQSKVQVTLDPETGLFVPQLPDPPKSVDTSGSESRHDISNIASGLKKRLKTPEGPIDYNDDGTLKGVELEHGLVSLQCRYCDFPTTSDPVEIKAHLAAKHARLQPIAIDVEAKEKGGLACLFVCSVFGCDYSSHYSNVFEHHMNLEHPDVESVRLVKKKRSTHKRTSTEKPRIQPSDLSGVSDKSESNSSKQLAGDESALVPSSKTSDDNSLITLSIPVTSASVSQPALSPVGTIASSEASNPCADWPAMGSPDELPASNDSSSKDSRILRKTRSKNLSCDYPFRYECLQCSFRCGSVEEMKGHLVIKHRQNFRSFYCIDRRARELRKRQKVLFCHDEQCGFYCKFEEELENHEKYTCTFAPRRHQKLGSEGVVQFMDSVLKVNTSPGLGTSAGESEKLYPPSSSSTSRSSTSVEDANNKMYQCSHCTFITTDLHNIRMHVIAEHAAEGGFAEIKTELGTDGNIVMNVNDRGVNELVSKSALNLNLVCDKNVVHESRSMYDAVDTVKIDDEEKVYTVL